MKFILKSYSLMRTWKLLGIFASNLISLYAEACEKLKWRIQGSLSNPCCNCFWQLFVVTLLLNLQTDFVFYICLCDMGKIGDDGVVSLSFMSFIWVLCIPWIRLFGLQKLSSVTYDLCGERVIKTGTGNFPLHSYVWITKYQSTLEPGNDNRGLNAFQSLLLSHSVRHYAIMVCGEQYLFKCNEKCISWRCCYALWKKMFVLVLFASALNFLFKV